MGGICCSLIIIVSDSQDHSILLLIIILRLYSSTAAFISVLGYTFFPFLCLMILLQQQQPYLSMRLLLLLLLPAICPLPTSVFFVLLYAHTWKRTERIRQLLHRAIESVEINACSLEQQTTNTQIWTLTNLDRECANYLRIEVHQAHAMVDVGGPALLKQLLRSWG